MPPAEASRHPLVREVDGMLIETAREWAEVCFVPSEIGKSKNGPQSRSIATRKPLAQKELPGLEQKQDALPLPTMDFGFINVAGRIVRSGRRLIVKLSGAPKRMAL